MMRSLSSPAAVTDRAAAKTSIDHLIRRFVPSLSKLTYNPIFGLIVDAADRPLTSLLGVSLPPNHMRIRVGVQNRLLNNQVNYLTEAYNFWLNAALKGYFTEESVIIDIGVGIGRSAHILRDFRFSGNVFRGTYIGIDIDKQMVEWCLRNFDSPRFRFHHSTDASVSYQQEGSRNQSYRIPEPDNSVDLIFSRSLYTHLLEPQAENYMRESYRLLKAGGNAVHSVFCLDYPPPSSGRHTFSHCIGNAYVESTKVPEAAVAYTEAYLRELAERIGFARCIIEHSDTDWQPTMVCTK